MYTYIIKYMILGGPSDVSWQGDVMQSAKIWIRRIRDSSFKSVRFGFVTRSQL